MNHSHEHFTRRTIVATRATELRRWILRELLLWALLWGLLLALAPLLITCGGAETNERAARLAGASASQAREVASDSVGDTGSANATPAAQTSSPGQEVNRPSAIGGLGMVLASKLNVRSGPGMSSDTIGLLACGDVVRVEEQEGEWYRITLDTLVGWCHQSWLNPIRAGGRMPRCGQPEWVGRALPVPTRPRRGPSPLAAESAVSSAQTASPAELLDAPPAQHGARDGIQAGVHAQAEVSDPAAQSATAQSRAVHSPPVLSPTAQAGSEGSFPLEAPVKGKKARAQGPRDPGPATIQLSTAGPKPGQVSFSHHQHNEQFECAQCHHEPKSEGALASKSDKACRNCHLRVPGEGSAKAKSKDVFHNTCRGCHQTSGAGPTKCSECHTPG